MQPARHLLVLLGLWLTLMLPCLGFADPAGAQTTEPQPIEALPIQAHVYQDEQGGELPYRLIVPEKTGDPMPLLLFLHGAGERGNDNEKQLVWGKNLLLQAASNYNCIVIIPQCPEGQAWSIVDWSQDKVTFADQPSEPMRMAQAVVDQMIQKYHVDTDRLYIMGLSMGGFGTWDAISRWPGRFAAAAPICGGGDPAMADVVKDTPIWAFHGEADPVVSVELSRVMIRAIKDAGGEPKYTEYPGIGHNSWSPAFAEPEFLPWLMSQRLADKNEDNKEE